MQRVYSPTSKVEPIRRTAFDMLTLFLLLSFFAVIGLAAIWGFWHTSRIYTGVSVGGVPIGAMTRAEAIRRLNSELADFPLPPVSIVYADKQWPLETAQINAQADLLGAVNQAYRVGRSGKLPQDLADQFAAALGWAEIMPQLAIDSDALRNAIETVAASVTRNGMAERRLGAVVVPAVEGVTVDVDATLQAVLTSLQTTRLHDMAQVPLVTHSVAVPAAPVVAAPVEAASSRQQPLLLRDPLSGLKLALTLADTRRLLTAAEPPQVDEARLTAYVESLATQIDRPAREARLRFNPATGGVTVLSPSAAGRKMDVAASVAAVRDALLSGATEAQLAVSTVAPEVDMNRIAEMGIGELVASGSTYFAGSSASRVRNIEVAAEQFDGVVIPPNRIFSFNRIVRDVSSANGFEDSLIIWGDRTAVGVGGGVCQVSTTLFRTAYEGGFPIVQRHNHGYVVDWYGEPGMDATIFTPTVDFQFRNDTDAYLLVEPSLDSANGVITFNFYGTRPDRVVTVGDPQISDVKQPEPPVYIVDEGLAPGQMKQVEWEKEGMSVTVQRTIVEDGTTRTDTLRSEYQPWKAVYLVGPGTDVPTPAATPATTP